MSDNIPQELDAQKLAVLRSIDKLDKMSTEDVFALLTTGRRDQSGDFTPGAGLDNSQAMLLLAVFSNPADKKAEPLRRRVLLIQALENMPSPRDSSKTMWDEVLAGPPDKVVASLDFIASNKEVMTNIAKCKANARFAPIINSWYGNTLDLTEENHA